MKKVTPLILIAVSVFLLSLIETRAGAQAPAPPAADAAVVTGAAGAAQPKTIFSVLGLSHDNLKKCKAWFCTTGVGQLANSMLAPVRLGSGGLLGNCCPDVPSPEKLAALAIAGNASPAEAAAAKIKADEAGAVARRSAIKYLATVDCHYYPEAEGALIAALRADRNECVRLDAAIALGNGCCCTKKTQEALALVVAGSDKDGNPGETSDRVKWAAMASLQRCMVRGADVPTPQPLETPPMPQPTLGRGPLPLPTIQNVGYQTRPTPVPAAPVLQDTQRLYLQSVGTSAAPALPTGNRSVFDIMTRGAATPQATAIALAAPTPVLPIGPRPLELPPLSPPLMPIGVLPPR